MFCAWIGEPEFTWSSWGFKIISREIYKCKLACILHLILSIATYWFRTPWPQPDTGRSCRTINVELVLCMCLFTCLPDSQLCCLVKKNFLEVLWSGRSPSSIIVNVSPLLCHFTWCFDPVKEINGLKSLIVPQFEICSIVLTFQYKRKLLMSVH